MSRKQTISICEKETFIEAIIDSKFCPTTTVNFIAEDVRTVSFLNIRNMHCVQKGTLLPQQNCMLADITLKGYLPRMGLVLSRLL